MRTRILVAVSATLLAVTAARAADETVATVGTVTITREQLEKAVKPQLIEVENQRFEILSDGLDELIAEQLFTLEAKSKDISSEQLVQTEINAKVPEPSDAEVQKVYDDNKAQLGGQTLDAVKPRIVEFLKQQKAEERHAAYVEELKGKYKTTVALKAPKVEVSTAGRPARGPESAPVTIIEFSDYECPFCKRAEVVVQEVVKAYPDKVKLVYRHFPLDFHEQAKPAAEASACAGAQGKFWEFHDKLFAGPSLSPERYKAIAAEVGLDQAKFDQCVQKNEFKAQIEQDMADASAVGVTGTPAFFINGRMISGAQPFEKFKEIIDEELAASAAPKS
ncbi:MAG: thioredoxin domain-containing protein [bacterium]|nr:thioredoxin domain-containing protein [bacterium]